MVISRASGQILRDVIIEDFNPNGRSAPLIPLETIIDDADDVKTKLVIQFEEEGCTAVLLLDSLIEEENIAVDGSPAAYEELREKLWNR